jgi:hypothetical protein
MRTRGICGIWVTVLEEIGPRVPQANLNTLNFIIISDRDS